MNIQMKVSDSKKERKKKKKRKNGVDKNRERLHDETNRQNKRKISMNSHVCVCVRAKVMPKIFEMKQDFVSN